MKNRYLLLGLCSLAIVPAAHAAFIVKANNTTALNLGGSWIGGAVPTSADVARFNSTLTGAAKSYSLGANTNWLGISFQKPSAAQTINGAFTLTLGASGIDASEANQDLNIECNVSLGVAQTWAVTNTGLIKVDGVISGTGPLTKTGSGQLFLRAPNTYTGDTFIKNGSLKFGLPSGSLNDRLPTTTVLTLGDGVANTGAQVILNARSQELAGLTTAGTSLTNNMVNGSATACTLTLNNTSDYTFNGVLGGPGANENNFAVIKSGAAKQTFSGVNTYSGATTISTGTLQLGDGTTGNDGTIASAQVANNAALVFNRFGSSSFGGVISGTGTVTKSGAGTQTLTATNTYSGATTISGGRLSVLTANTGGGSYTNADGTTLGVTLVNAGTSLTMSSYGTGANCTNTYAFGTIGSNTAPAISVSGGLAMNGDVTVNVTGGGWVIKTNVLLQYTGTRSGSGSFVLGTSSVMPPLAAEIVDDTGNQQVLLVVFTAAVDSIWTGAASATWTAPGNWNSTVPTAVDTVIYTNNGALNLSQTLDANTAIGNLIFKDLPSPVTLSGGGAFTLTNATGIDMAAAGADLTVLANYAPLTTAHSLKVAANRTLTLSNVVADIGSTIAGPGTVRVTGIAGAMTSLTNSVTLCVDGGSINNGSAGTLPLTTAAGAGQTVLTVLTNGGSLSLLGAVNSKTIVLGNAGTGTNILNMYAGSSLVVTNADNANNANQLQLGGASGAMGIVNLNGGTMTLAAVRVSSSLVGETTLRVGAASGGTGVLNLNGGTAIIPRFETTAGSTSTINFNGTTVVGNKTNTTWLHDMTFANVQAGGAIFDSSNYSQTISQALLHDAALGATPDGGLTKRGAGRLTLSGTNTYTGNTMISNGTLALSGSGSISNTPQILVGGGGTFDVSGLSSTFILGSAQTLSNSASATGTLNGNLNASTGTNSVSYVSGTPAFTVTNGTLTLSGSTVIQVNNAGAQLLHSTNKVIAKATTGNVGWVAGTLPTVTVSGGGAAAPVSLQIVSGELYLNVNNPPVAKAITNGAPAGVTNVIRIIGGKPHIAPTDADNDPLLVSSVAMVTAPSGTVSTDGTNIFYAPGLNASGSGTLDYVVSDGYGGFGTNTMYVTVTGQSFNIVSGPTLTNNQFEVSFAGIPHYTYTVDDSTNSASGPWAYFTNLTAGTNGLFQLVVTNDPSVSQRYFRTRYQP